MEQKLAFDVKCIFTDNAPIFFECINLEPSFKISQEIYGIVKWNICFHITSLSLFRTKNYFDVKYDKKHQKIVAHIGR